MLAAGSTSGLSLVFQSRRSRVFCGVAFDSVPEADIIAQTFGFLADRSLSKGGFGFQFSRIVF